MPCFLAGSGIFDFFIRGQELGGRNGALFLKTHYTANPPGISSLDWFNFNVLRKLVSSSDTVSRDALPFSTCVHGGWSSFIIFILFIATSQDSAETPANITRVGDCQPRFFQFHQTSGVRYCNICMESMVVFYTVGKP